MPPHHLPTLLSPTITQILGLELVREITDILLRRTLPPFPLSCFCIFYSYQNTHMYPKLCILDTVTNHATFLWGNSSCPSQVFSVSWNMDCDGSKWVCLLVAIPYFIYRQNVLFEVFSLVNRLARSSRDLAWNFLPFIAMGNLIPYLLIMRWREYLNSNHFVIGKEILLYPAFLFSSIVLIFFSS